MEVNLQMTFKMNFKDILKVISILYVKFAITLKNSVSFCTTLPLATC